MVFALFGDVLYHTQDVQEFSIVVDNRGWSDLGQQPRAVAPQSGDFALQFHFILIDEGTNTFVALGRNGEFSFNLPEH